MSHGLAEGIFPNFTNYVRSTMLSATPAITALAHVKLRRDSREFKSVERILNMSILDTHTSFKVHPYRYFVIDNILRLENLNRWLECKNEPKSRTNPWHYRYFLHGTSLPVTKAIENGNFMQSTAGDFGPGIYLSENSSVSHLFAMDKVWCPAGCTFVNPNNGKTVPNKMNFRTDQTASNVNCHECHAQNIKAKFYFECSKCHKILCRSCADKNVNGNGWCYMLVCICNIGDFKKTQAVAVSQNPTRLPQFAPGTSSHRPGDANTVQGHCAKGYEEFVVLKPERVYPCYRIKYKTNVAAGK
jgi:hypothetical protein